MRVVPDMSQEVAHFHLCMHHLHGVKKGRSYHGGSVTVDIHWELRASNPIKDQTRTTMLVNEDQGAISKNKGKRNQYLVG